MPLTNKMAHLFHWPSFLEYQQNLLKVIALPIGARGQLNYRDIWVNKTFTDEIENINKSGGIDAIFWVLSNTQSRNNDNKVVNTFDFACPIRLVHILNVDVQREVGRKYINFIAKEFLSNFRKIDKQNDLKDYVKVEFGSPEIPYPGVEKGFVYIGPRINGMKTTQTPSLEELYGALENIPCSLEYTEGITIKDYPLVMIKTIEKSKVNKSGLYKLSSNKEYKIALSYYQGAPYRNRRIYINQNRFVGQSATHEITIGEVGKSKDKIDLEVKSRNLSFPIPLNVVVEIPWHKRKFTPLLALVAISAILLYLFVSLFPESSIEIRIALGVPLIVILLNKFFEVWTKKG